MSKLPPLPRRSLALACAAASLGLACTPAQGRHYGPQDPENQALAHKPTYVIQATIEDGEMLEKTGTGPGVAQGSPPDEIPPLHQWANPTMDSAPTSLQIDASLAQACNVPDAKAFFGTDTSDLQPEAQAALKALAECFTTGPMKGHRLSITGHADPQGSETYNKQLGWERASAVASFLAANGLDPHEMEQQSAGEDAAHQDDPSMWAYDRKVVLDVSVQEDDASESVPQ